MITGAHAIIYSKKPDADRAFFKDVLKFPHVDVGGGWLIFALPPSEVAVHPAAIGGKHELYFLVADIHEFITAMKKAKRKTTAVKDQGWGLVTKLMLPGGGKIGVYEPRHARPKARK